MATSESAALDRKHRLVIFASSLGTVFEWYDFYIYATLAAFFGKLFFPPGNETAGFLASLAAVGVGFSVRPFGALVFGRLGDLVGRKYTFLVTIVVMGSATALIGILPTYASIGFWAPVLLFLLRLAQGLALGGEYGGAATYVAEHAPANKRGAFTSWIQITATLGLFLSLAVILTVRQLMSPESFASWGWRVPFGVSVLLLGVSVYIRLKLEESPVFAEMKAEGKHSKSPLTESFGRKDNLIVVLKALFGATAGQGVVWYAGQFYALYFLTTTLKVNYIVGYELIAAALLIGTPFFLFFGSLSDKIGRKWLILSGMFLTVFTYQPIFHGLTNAANPALERAMQVHPVTLHTEDFHGNVAVVGEALVDAARKIVLPSKISSETDQARNYLNTRGIPFTLEGALAGQHISLTVGEATLNGFDKAAYEKALAPAGYPLAADTSQINWVKAISLLSLLVIYVALVYGPVAAFLVELFPTRIRYTSMSLPYHIGNGWFGGFLPLIAASIAVFTGNIYAGLWYPITIAGLCFIIGAIVLPETKDRDISKDNY
jgi:MFS family permease